MISNRTEQALDAVYEMFSSVPKPSQVVGCPCCMTEIDPCTLLAVPLRKLTAETLEVYAANVLLTVGGPEDFRYFLPRLLDISIRDGFYWPDPEVLFGKLHLAEWQSWSEVERLTVQKLFAAHFDDAVNAAMDGLGKFDVCRVDTCLCAIGCARLSLAPFLRRLSEPHLGELRRALLSENQSALSNGRLSNSFWEEAPLAMAEVIAWLRSDS